MSYYQILKFENVKRVINQQFQSITAAAIVISITTLASRFLGLIRDHILAGKFGAGEVLDIYYASFRMPDLVYNLLMIGAISAGFIPVFTRYLIVSDDNKEILGNKKSWDLVNNILNILVAIVCAVCVLMIIFLPYYMKFLVPGFNENQLNETITLTRLMFLSPIFLCISGIFGDILQSFKRFFIYSLAPIFYNFGIIAGVLFFYDIWGMRGLGLGVVLGAFLHMIIQITASLSLGYKYEFLFNIKDKGLMIILKMMVPRLLTMAVSQFNLIIITIIATTLDKGALSVFNFASNLQGVPLGLFGVSFAIAVFPTLSFYSNQNEWEKFSKTFASVTGQILFFIIPSSILIYIFRAQIVRLILGSGNFDWTDTILTLNALGIFALSLFAQSLIPLLTKTFYTVEDTKTPFYISLFSMIINVILSIFLSAHYGILGLVWAFSLSAIAQFIILWISLHAKIGNLEENDILISSAKILAASMIMGIFAQGCKYYLGTILDIDTVIGIFTQTVVSGVIAVLLFIVFALFLNIKEMKMIKSSLQKRILKLIDLPKAKIEQ